MLDLHLAGIGREIGSEPLPMHAGLDVELEDGRRFVVEQPFGTLRENFVNGLNWTPLETFKRRDHAGWDVTIPPRLFGKLIRALLALGFVAIVAFLKSLPLNRRCRNG
jgi:hypothetical protein